MYVNTDNIYNIFITYLIRLQNLHEILVKAKLYTSAIQTLLSA